MKPATIVVNTRMLLKDRLDGTGWFAYQLLKRITQTHPEVRFIFLFDRPYSQEFIFSPNITGQVVYPPIRHPFLYYIWFQIAVKRVVQRLKPDLFLSLDGSLPLGVSRPTIAVIHDINFKHRPQDLKFLTAKFFNHFFPKYARAATRIITVSEYSKQDIATEYHIDPTKIDVVYNGVNEGFRPLSRQEQETVRQTHIQGKPYFLFIGSIHPRKNIVRLLQAFELFKETSKSDLKLVIAGAFFWGKTEIDQALAAMQFKSDVIFTGRVSEETLQQLTGAAFCLTYTPYFEGFGVPIVQAMQAEIPIISANVTSLPEVAGSAALYVDPFKVEEIQDAMLKIYTDEKLRMSLIEDGKRERERFSWDKSAEELWGVIEKIN